MFQKNFRLQSPLRDDGFGGGGGGGTGGAAGVKAAKKTEEPANSRKVPQEFLDEMHVIEQWAIANDVDAKHDIVQFWMLKLPAIVVSASAAVFVYFKSDAFAILASAVASACVLIDGLRPKGMLYRAHRRASNDIHKLHSDMASQWRVGILGDKLANELAAEIIGQSRKEKDRISNYLTEAETSLVESNSPKV